VEKGDLLDGLLHLLGGEAPREPVCGGEPLALQLAHQLLLRFDLVTRKNILKGQYIRFLQNADLVLQAAYSANKQVFTDSTTYIQLYVLQRGTISFNGMYSSLINVYLPR